VTSLGGIDKLMKPDSEQFDHNSKWHFGSNCQGWQCWKEASVMRHWLKGNLNGTMTKDIARTLGWIAELGGPCNILPGFYRGVEICLKQAKGIEICHS